MEIKLNLTLKDREKIIPKCRILISYIKENYCQFLPFIFFFALMIGLLSLVSIQEGDDVYFASAHLNYSITEFLLMRYHNWSGRFFSEILSYLFTGQLLFLWKWLCALCLTANAFIFYYLVNYNKTVERKLKIRFAYLSCFIIFLISSSILNSSVFWITGALNYLVPFTFGLISIIPFLRSVIDNTYRPNALSIIFVVTSIFAVTGSEQTVMDPKNWTPT